MSPHAFILGVWAPRQTCSWVTDFKVLRYLLQLREKYVSDLKLVNWRCWCLTLDQQVLLYRKKCFFKFITKDLISITSYEGRSNRTQHGIMITSIFANSTVLSGLNALTQDTTLHSTKQVSTDVSAVFHTWPRKDELQVRCHLSPLQTLPLHLELYCSLWKVLYTWQSVSMCANIFSTIHENIQLFSIIHCGKRTSVEHLHFSQH